VIRVLANLLGLPGFDFESAQDVLAVMHPDGVPAFAPAARLGNDTTALIDLSPAATDPVVASIYQLDGTVRRATSLQLTADARAAATAQEALA